MFSFYTTKEYIESDCLIGCISLGLSVWIVELSVARDNGDGMIANDGYT